MSMTTVPPNEHRIFGTRGGNEPTNIRIHNVSNEDVHVILDVVGGQRVRQATEWLTGPGYHERKTVAFRFSETDRWRDAQVWYAGALLEVQNLGHGDIEVSVDG